MNWFGIEPPLTESTNSKPLPRGSGSILKHLAEPPGAAGLLLVPVVAVGARGDGLAEGDRRRPGVEVELVLCGHLLQHCFQVHLAETAHHRLVRLRVVLDAEAGILGDDPVQHVRDLLLVAVLLRLHREAEHRGRQLERRGVHVRIGRRVVQDVVELDHVDLGDGADVARDRLAHLDLRLAAQQVQVPGLDRLPRLADVELRAGGQAALVHAEHRDAADVGVDLDLEDVCQHVLARIGDRQQLGRLAADGGAVVGGRVALGRVGEQLLDHL